MAGDLAERAIEEVRELHAFFVSWFRDGGSPKDFARCDAALAEDFRVVTPEGEVHDRANVVERLRGARGGAPADFAIEVLQPCVVWKSGDAVLLEYIEQQYRDGRRTSRRSTGLFTNAPAAPCGVVWRHLQETWVQPG